MSTSDSCKEGSSKSKCDDACDEVNDMLQNMSTVGTDVVVSVCANCGKEGDDVNNICNKCKQVKYCNAVCKKVHKKKHMKDCKEHVRRAVEKHEEEIRRAAELHDIELFKQPQTEDCPICFIRLPILDPTGKKYMTCCGKVICSGCIHAPVYDNQGNVVTKKSCPFCRTPQPITEKENIKREKKRVELDDPIAIYNTGCNYAEGLKGFPQDHTKTLELWHRAGELGFLLAYLNIGNRYHNGQGVEVDMEKAKQYYELAAIGGDETERYNLGVMENNAGNMNRALKHFTIAVRGGNVDCLETIKRLYSYGHATKDDYTKALRLYQEYLGDIKSPQRDEAAAFSIELYRYY